MLAYATTVSITSYGNQAQYGISYDVTNTNLTASDQGFATIPVTASASSLPCTWSNGGTCNQALTKGQYKYTVLVTIVAPPSSTTTYTITTKWDQGAGQSTMGGVTISVPNTAVAGQTMKIVFSTGATSFTTPLAIDVTVA